MTLSMTPMHVCREGFSNFVLVSVTFVVHTSPASYLLNKNGPSVGEDHSDRKQSAICVLPFRPLSGEIP